MHFRKGDDFKMRPTLAIFLVIAFCSCKQKREQAITTQDSISTNKANKSTIQKSEKDTAEKTTLEWEKQEENLRKEILSQKEKATLKSSSLQEMYIRNVLRVSKDSLSIKIPFDLHGPDCGAPDCYSTDVSFGFKLGDSLIFPKDLQFQEHEHGCVDKEKRLTGRFKLVVQTNKHVIYYSAKHKRTLVLFSTNKISGTAAYYFTGVEQNTINEQNVYRIIEDYDEENKNSIYPFTSWILTTNEYENFANKSGRKKT